MKKRAFALLLALVFALALPAPALAAGTIEVTEDISVSADYDWTRFAGQNLTLNVYNWGEYISNGSDDSVDVVDAFERLTGIKVNYTTFDSNESMYAKLKSGAANYDVIIPSDYMVAKMIAEEMLLPLDYSNIPNFAAINEEYRCPDYDPDNAYTVPYMLCTTGIIYNTTMVEEAPTAWADLWDEQYAGSILMFNNSRDAYSIAAFKLGKSINPSSAAEVDEVVEELKKQKPLVQAYVMDEIFDKMIGGEAAVGVYYSGDAITMIDDNPDLAWVFPEEGSVLSVDCMCVPATSQHQEAAEMFINFMCEQDVGVANTEYIGYTTPMENVWEALDEELKYSEIAYPAEELAAKEQVFTALSDEVNSELDVKWSEMKSYDEGGSAVIFLLLLLAMLALAIFNIWRKLRKKSRNQY
ncbi:MAG: PotD/PotF family extracellular solute-binding protein [Faecalibacterium sp.]